MSLEEAEHAAHVALSPRSEEWDAIALVQTDELPHCDGAAVPRVSQLTEPNRQGTRLIFGERSVGVAEALAVLGAATGADLARDRAAGRALV